MSNLLSRAKVSLNNARSNWQNASLDDAYINSACFQLQQSFEFALKFAVELEGKTYIKNHDLRAQLNLLTNSKVSKGILNNIASKSEMYNKWEVESRYNDNFVALYSDVEEALVLCDNLIKEVESLLPTCDLKSNAAITWCRNNAPEAFKNLTDDELWSQMKDMYVKYGNPI